MHGQAAGGFERAAQRAFGDAGLGDHRAHAGGQDGAQHRVLSQLVDHIGGGEVGARDRNHLFEQACGRDPRGAQAGKPFKHQCQRDDGAQKQRPDRPSGGLYDRKQATPFVGGLGFSGRAIMSPAVSRATIQAGSHDAAFATLANPKSEVRIVHRDCG